MRKTLIILFFGLFTTAALAQAPQKIGHADGEYIFTQLPEYKQIESELKTFSTQLDNQLKAKYQDYQAKLDAYNKLPATTPEAIKKDQESTLLQLQENIQKFQEDARNSIQKKQTDLMAPVYEKVGKAIEAVAKENGYAYILSPQLAGGGDIALYADDQYNISALVLKKLGVTPAPANTTSATTPTTVTTPTKKP